MAATPPLRYYPDKRPGIARQRCRHGFSYFAQDGTRITDKVERARMNALTVPPAYENVWMSSFENGDLQAMGYDARGRKQYRYHPAWSAAQSQTKFAGLADFGVVLPRWRRFILRDLHSEAGAPRFAPAASLALNDYTAERSGTDGVTARTFRTWSGTVAAFKVAMPTTRRASRTWPKPQRRV